jgi:metal-dependent amidase/aminoacylase/carboxypeptidase family protein
MINDPEMTAFAQSVAEELLGEDHVHYGKPIMAGEDLSFVLEKVPGCMISLGTGNPDKGFIFPPHHPRFDADEDALAVGVRLLAGIALRYLDADV